jgi:hypothetical protein
VIPRSRECTACGAAIGPALYGECARCSSVTLCEPCASRHWCNGDQCRDFGCVPGQCIKLVIDGVMPPRRLGPDAARERWGER